MKKTIVTQVTKRVLWWSWQETIWTKICTKTPNPNPIETKVNTMSIRGRQNNITQAIPEVDTIANVSKWAFTGAAVGCWAKAWATFGFTLPCAIGATDGAYVTWNLNNVWASTVVGQSQGDSIVPLNSQDMYEYLGPDILGGKPVFNRFRDVDNGTHVGIGGVLDNEKTRDYIREFQDIAKLDKIPQ